MFVCRVQFNDCLADIFSAPNSVVVVDGYLERLAPDVGSFHRRVDKCLVPLWLQSSRHCLCPSLAFLASFWQKIEFTVWVTRLTIVTRWKVDRTDNSHYQLAAAGIVEHLHLHFSTVLLSVRMSVNSSGRSGRSDRHTWLVKSAEVLLILCKSLRCKKNEVSRESPVCLEAPGFPLAVHPFEWASGPSAQRVDPSSTQR